MDDTLQGITRSASVTEHLREAILSGELPPGEHLHEVRLSKSLGVSRTPIRAAFQSLAVAGLLDYAPNRGYVVRDFPMSELVDAYDIRGTLEGLAARFASERGLDAAQCATIQKALAEGDALLKRTTRLDDAFRAAFREINVPIHDTILEGARNRMLGEMIRVSYEKPRVSNRNIVAVDLAEMKIRHGEHHLIYEAIMARQASRAEALMREHVASVKGNIVKGLLAPSNHPTSVIQG